MKRKILITNDDGIRSEGLARLTESAVEFGEVWVVAPEGQCSAASHSITLRHSVKVHPCEFPVRNVHAFYCTGTPGDCVRVGSLNVMPEKPDLVLSGINYGYNMATDIQYSATAGAAFEAEFQGYSAAALSEAACSLHEVTDRYLREILKEIIEEKYVPGQIINVNFPGCPLSECRGKLRNRSVSGQAYYKDHYNVINKLPDGGMELMVEGVHEPVFEEGTDYAAILDNYISIGRVSNIGRT